MVTSNFHFCFTLLLSILLIAADCLGYDPQQTTKQVPLFLFGDSFFDAGNNNYINTTTSFQANYWPYGETFFRYPTGRPSDGRLIPDFIAEYAKLPLIPPYHQPGNHQFAYGANFASAGAGAFDETNAGLVISLKTQLSDFKNVKQQLTKKLGNKDAKQLLSNAVYLFSIGTNDYLTPFLTNSSVLQSYSQGEYVGMVISNVTAVIKEVYDEGGRKFGFVNVLPVGCVPLTRALGNTGDCMKEMTTLVKLHNKALSKVLQSLERQLKGFTYSIFDFYNAASERMDNPSKYGFKEGESACCGSGPYRGVRSCGGKTGIKEYELCPKPSEFVFFDSIHLTEVAYQQFAKLMWTGTSDIVCPYNLKALFQPTQD